MTGSKTSFSLVCALSLPLPACDFEMPDDDDDAESGGGAQEESGDESSGESDDDPASDASDAIDESSEGGVEDTGDPVAEMPAELLGLWVIPGSTAGAAIAFADDGSYARANVGETTIGSCTTSIETVSAGWFVVSGDEIELQPTEALKTVDECGTVTESEDLPPPETLAWQIGQDEWGEALVLTDESGYAATYHRE